MTEMPPEPQQIPAAFSPNGHRPSERLAQLIEELPQMLVNAVASGMDHVLRQVPVRLAASPWRCTGCAKARLAWIHAHEKEAMAANAAYAAALQQAASLPDDDPHRRPVPEFAMFLPPDLRPGGAKGMPPIADGPLLVDGSAWCMDHMPGAPGKTGLLLANAAGMITGVASF